MENEQYRIELDLYHECLYDIRQRIDIINAHVHKTITEKFLIIEVETVCLQFRKILESIALLSLIVNKEAYAEQNEKFAKHYHAGRIIKDLERINPDFYPKPIKRVPKENTYDELVNVTEGYLTKDEFVNIYERCGGMMHARNPFASQRTQKDLQELMQLFPVWLSKICVLLSQHEIKLYGGKLMVVAMLARSDNGFPQAVIMERIDDEEALNK